MDITELENMLILLSQSITDLENIAGYSDVEDEEGYHDDLESTAYYVASLAEDIVTFLKTNRIKDLRDDANSYFKIDSLDARLKAELLATHFEEMTYSEFSDMFDNPNMRNFF